MFRIDRTSSSPLTEQIVEQIETLVKSGQLPAGAKLPSIRQLSAQLDVSPYTVVTAYDKLVASDIIGSRASGFFVKGNSAASANALDDFAEAETQFDALWLVRNAHQPRQGMLPAGSGAIPPAWLEDAVTASAVQRVFRKDQSAGIARCPPQGLPELREQLSIRLRTQGIAADASRIVVTQGATQAIDLICRALLKPG